MSNLTNNAMGIKKVIIKSASGYGSMDYAYNDKLVITPQSISYECNPLFEDRSEIDKEKWEYKTENPQFLTKFKEISLKAEEYMDKVWDYCVMDAGTIKISIVYEDNKRNDKDFCVWKSEFTELFDMVKTIIPSFEPIPLAIDLEEDDKEEE